MPRDHSDDRDDRDDDRDDREDREDQPDDQEPEETFWQRYSPRFEMPISYVASALTIALALFVATLLVFATMTADEKFKLGPQIGLAGGDDDFGNGETGGGGQIDPKVLGHNAPTRDDMKEVLPDLDSKLPTVKEEMAKSFKLEDPNSAFTIPDSKATAYAGLDAKIRDKMFGVKKGDGTQGNGGEGNNPNGAGTGTGADSTRARTMRWVIAFKTNSGRDYLDQLDALGAKVLVPTADGKSVWLFSSLKGNPPEKKLMGEADWNQLSGLVQFSDYTPLSRDQVGAALGMGNLPKGFWAFFPKEVEQDLAKKEVGFQQRRSEDIEETKFECVNRNGTYQLVVTRQTLKK